MKFSVVSLFSGGGGLDLGFKSNDFSLIWASDIDKNAVETYKYNIGDHIHHADINNYPIDQIPHADVLIGGPPCQSFSLIGKRNVNDDRGKLVWKYLEILKHVNPYFFVFENVTGILSAKDRDGKKVLDSLLEEFNELGYVVKWNVINAADYGVPQRRKRVLVVGSKLGDFNFPSQTHSIDGIILPKYVSVLEALGDLPIATVNSKSQEYNQKPLNSYQKRIRGHAKIVTDHSIPTTSSLDEFIIQHVKPGGNYMDIPKDVASVRIKRLQEQGGHTTCYGRLHPNEPAYTINTYFNRPNVGCNIHYSYNRLITVREALRLQGFPDDYQIISSSKQGKNLIVGNAVPPILSDVIARQIKKHLEANLCG